MYGLSNHRTADAMTSTLTRRTLLTSIAAAAAAGGACAALPAAACSGSLLRVGLDVFPQTLNPLEARDLHATRVIASMYEGLTRIDGDGRVLPALAERWEFAEDGLSWRFHLRRGARFHTGRPCTARDVKRTFDGLLANPAAPSFAVPGLSKVLGFQEASRDPRLGLRGVEAVDDHTLVVRFSEPCAIFPLFKFHIVDVDFVEGRGPDWYTKASAGTGPYRFSTWKPGTRIYLERHEDWWGGASSYESLVFSVTGGREASVAAFTGNDVDLVLIDADMVRPISDDIGFRRSLTSVRRMQCRSIGFDQSRYAPFRDRRVRLAMSKMIDRAAVSERFFRGMAAVHRGVVPPPLLGEGHLQVLDYDPAAAAALLAEAGFPGGRGLEPFELTAPPEYRQEFAYYVSQWGTIGIPAALNVVPRTEFVAKVHKREYAAFHMGWTGSYPDAMHFLGDLFRTGAPFNYTGWSNERFDSLLARANATPGRGERDAVYREAERLVMDDLPVLPIVVPDYVALRCEESADRHLYPYGGILIR